MPLDHWLAFLLASLLLLAIPGPTVLTVIGHSLAHGRRAGRSLLAAVFLGDATCAALSLAGVGLILQASELGLGLLQAAGAICLACLGFGLFRVSESDTQPSAPPASMKNSSVFGSTYLVTALNPKGVIFLSSFLPLFVAPEHPVTPQLWILAATFVSLATLTAGLFAWWASSVRAAVGLSAWRVPARRAVGGLMMLMGLLALVWLYE